MTLLKNLIVAAAVGAISISAMAADTPETAKAEHDIVLKDGSTLHVFKDGKMAMEDKYGRAVRMEEGAQMETKERVGRDSCKKRQKLSYPIDSLGIIRTSNFSGSTLRRKSSV